MMTLTQIRDRLLLAFSSEKMTSAEQKLRSKHFPEEVHYMGTRTWCNLNSSEVMDMARALAVYIEEAEE